MPINFIVIFDQLKGKNFGFNLWLELVRLVVVRYLPPFNSLFKMQTTRWNTKRISIAAVILLGVYVVFSASYNKHELEGTVHNIKPEKVWDFVADFGNMKLLNPTM